MCSTWCGRRRCAHPAARRAGGALIRKTPWSAAPQEAVLDWLLLHLDPADLPRRYADQPGGRGGGPVDVRLRAAAEEASVEEEDEQQAAQRQEEEAAAARQREAARREAEEAARRAEEEAKRKQVGPTATDRWSPVPQCLSTKKQLAWEHGRRLAGQPLYGSRRQAGPQGGREVVQRAASGIILSFALLAVQQPATMWVLFVCRPRRRKRTRQRGVPG